jgi:ubiquinone/menaquinone biosynthesis C-methylase UbiE
MATLARRFCEFENRWLFLRPRQVIAERVKGQRMLDVCCGSGDLSAQLAAAGCHVVGVDSSERMVSYAREKRTAAQFEVMDASAMPFEHEFDAAVISLALHALSPLVRERVWEAMVRAVTAGGLLIALDYAPQQQRTLLGRTAYWLIERDERSFLKSDPQHHHNFHAFMQNGGLRAWALAQREETIQQQDYWGGTVELAVLRRSSADRSMR